MNVKELLTRLTIDELTELYSLVAGEARRRAAARSDQSGTSAPGEAKVICVGKLRDALHELRKAYEAFPCDEVAQLVDAVECSLPIGNG